MRQIGRTEFLAELRDLDSQADQALGGPTERQYHSEGSITVVTWVRAGPLLLADTPQNPNTTQGLGQFDRKLATAVQEVNRMGKLQQIAARAPAVVKSLEDRADKLGQRLDGLEKRGNDTFDRWDGHLTEQEQAVGQAEDAINQLSNGAPGPLPAS